MQADDLPFAIDLSPHVSLECFRRNPCAIGLAHTIVEEGRHYSDITTGHNIYLKIRQFVKLDATARPRFPCVGKSIEFCLHLRRIHQLMIR